MENSIFELLVDNLGRLNEEEESDKQGVFHILGALRYIVAVRCRSHGRLQEYSKISSGSMPILRLSWSQRPRL